MTGMHPNDTVINRDWQWALDAAARAEQFIEATGERCHQAELLRVVGELLASTDRAGAEAKLNAAVALAAAQGALIYEQRAAASLEHLRGSA